MTLLNTINVGLLITLNSFDFGYYGASADAIGDFKFRKGYFGKFSSGWYSEV